MIKVVAKQTVPEGKQEEYLAIAKELFEKTRQEKGNIFYTLNRSVQDPTSLAVIECWEDQEALSARSARGKARSRCSKRYSKTYSSSFFHSRYHTFERNCP